MSDDIDEATQLVLLASLLEPAIYPSSELLAALRKARGDLSRAAEELLLPRVKSAGKRKAGTTLESWLGKKRGGQVIDLAANETSDDLDPTGNSARVRSEAESQSRSERPNDAPSPARKNAFAMLKSGSNTVAASEVKVRSAPQPALLLTSQNAVDKHGLPLTFLESPLSPAFASALYLAMMEESEKWDRHRWYLAGRWVESPHTSANYRQVGGGHGMEGVEGAKDPNDKDERGGQGDQAGSSNTNIPRYFYSGLELNTPDIFFARQQNSSSPLSTPRFPLELDILSNGLDHGKLTFAERIDTTERAVVWDGMQISLPVSYDRSAQLTPDLGPYATIASLSLGTPRAFRLRETDTVDPSFKASTAPKSAAIRTYEVNLGHNSLILMNGGCQERYKHTVPPQKALDLFRPGWTIEREPIPLVDQKTYTARINITFRQDFHPSPGTGPTGPRQGTPYCKCGIPTLLRADQKAKARSRNPSAISPRKPSQRETRDTIDTTSKPGMIEDDMAFFWQCQSPGTTGDLKGCGFFRVLDMKAEGRGPCVVDVVGS